MFCPKCGANNLEEAQFCRSCGANVSLVTQALTGQLTAPIVPAAPPAIVPVNEKGRPVSPVSAIRNLFMGLAFIIISLVLSTMPMGYSWWFWMLLPALGLIGRGVGEFAQIIEHRKQLASAPQVSLPTYTAPAAMPPYTTSELPPRPFSSITESTTRHLNDEARTRHLEREK